MFSHHQTNSIITAIIAIWANHNTSTYSHEVLIIQTIRTQSVDLGKIFKLNILTSFDMFYMSNMCIFPTNSIPCASFKKILSSSKVQLLYDTK